MQPPCWHETHSASSEESPPNYERSSEKLSPAKARRLRSRAGRARPGLTLREGNRR